ncbi:hypothetical protein D8674_037160 [Pyrus ussuriensis x Pyrus communis]|uniref:Sieve element occlusion N-terminal domain-containing protein n=1 Tax=Pyrus ussuriensis x Pyrus communis TaxID=2448454 RepID=A0A5N5G338_9ROSA|nr:hypothetical protein D8674_037160 [Pyrus ussuriensis x Pyrus communis]
MAAAQNYNNPPAPAAQNYNPAPMPAAQNYNPAPMPVAQNYNPAPMPVAQNYNLTPMPTAQNYNPARVPAAQSYNAPQAPGAQSYNAPQAPGAQSYNAPQAPGAQYYNKPTAGGRRGGDYYNRPLPKDGRRFSSTASDDSMLTNQILASDKSHARPYDVTLLSLKHILQTVDVILSRVTQPDIHSTVTGALVPGAHADALEHEKASHAIISSLPDNYDVPTSLFNAISCEIFCKWLSGEDANKTTMDILDTVQHYDWDEKVVLALGAFAVKDGEYWLVAHLYTTNPLAKAVGQLKQVQEILEHAGTRLKPKFDAYNNLVRAVLNVTKCIVQLHDLHRNPVMTTEAESAATTALIPTAVYWTIRSIVVAATQLLGITGMGPEHMTEAWELSSLAHKLENIHSHLKENLDRLLDIIKRKKEEQELSEISYILESPHIDNSKPLRVLFYKDDQPALYDCYNKKRVDIDVLKRKVVILFLSDIDVVHENEYMIVQQMYLEKRQNPTRTESQYEVVWVPIVDMWTEAKYQQFEDLRRNMEWYTLFHPSVVPKTVIRYIRKQDKWNYGKKPLLVVMDPQGKIVHTNAVHMMCVWGSIAFPFTSNREKLLWEEEKDWRIELLADAIDQNLITWYVYSAPNPGQAAAAAAPIAVLVGVTGISFAVFPLGKSLPLALAKALACGVAGAVLVYRIIHRQLGHLLVKSMSSEAEQTEGTIQQKNIGFLSDIAGPTGTQLEIVYGVFGYMQVLSACFMAFAHGGNDVSNAIGPLAGALSILHGCASGPEIVIPTDVLAWGGFGIVAGLTMWGYSVIATIGKKITELTPTRGFAAEFAAASVVLFASKLGLPISATHTLVGAVMGVGFARGLNRVRAETVREIVASWAVTIPAGAFFSVLYTWIFTKSLSYIL